jgi:hypothetical protein
VPLIATGTAIAGATAGAVVAARAAKNGSSRPTLKRAAAIGKAATSLDAGTVKSAAGRVSAYAQQAADIASAVEETRKKNG